MLKTEILRIAKLMAEEPNEVSREIYLDQLSDLLGDTQAESLVLAGYLRQFKRSWDATQPSRIDFDEWIDFCIDNLEQGSEHISVPVEEWNSLMQTARAYERLKEVHGLAVQMWAKESEDLKFFLEQSIIIEHRQDHEKMRKLRKEYGYDF